MLFLAVFLGFLAENFREHQVEKAKEKEYMVSMLSDLNKDTASINTSVSAIKTLILGQDSTLHFLAADLQNKDSSALALIYFYRYCIYQKFVRFTDGTVSQLKNNGGLRLLRNKELIDKINSYYNEITVIKSEQESISEYLNIIDRQAGEIFNYKANKNFIDFANLSEIFVFEYPLTHLRTLLTNKVSTMLTTDVKSLSPFMSNISYHMGVLKNFTGLLYIQKEKAAELMDAIKKGYHVESE